MSSDCEPKRRRKKKNKYGVHTCVNGAFSEERSTAYPRFAFSRVRPSILWLDEHQGDLTRRWDEGRLTSANTSKTGPPSPMDIAESSRTINPFLAFYVLNVPPDTEELA